MVASAATPGFLPLFPDSKPLRVPVPSKAAEGSPALELHVEDSGTPSSTSHAPSHTFLCLHGIGDVRQQFRFLAPLLRDQGHRVLAADLRGHGDSSVDFPSYTPLDVSSDIGDILSAYGVHRDVVLVGNSLAASSALHYAALHPETVSAVVCLAPVARDLPQDKSFRLLSHALFSPPWGASLWVSYFDSLFKHNKPQDLESYKAALAAKTKEKGRLSALGQMMRGSKTPCFQEVDKVQCPVLLLHGEKDPDFKNPAQEAEDVKAALTSSRKVVVDVMPALGHYPHVEEPEKCFNIIKNFVNEISA